MVAKMSPGDMTERVLVKKATISETDGAQSPTMSTVGTYWCQVLPVRSSERASDGIEFYTEAFRFRFRRFAATIAIDHDYRLTWDGRSYDVKQKANKLDRYTVEVLAELHEPDARSA